MPEYLKTPTQPESAVEEHVRSTVSEILLAVEREGEVAVRRYSERFDRWSPPSFRVAATEVDRAEAAVDAELRGHIEFVLQQIRRFASLQEDSHVEFEVETLPGELLGQKLIPVNAVGSYAPGGRFPLVASSLRRSGSSSARSASTSWRDRRRCSCSQDQTADPELVAIDLLGQAEHEPTSPATLATTSEALARAVVTACERLLEAWPTVGTYCPRAGRPATREASRSGSSSSRSPTRPCPPQARSPSRRWSQRSATPR